MAEEKIKCPFCGAPINATPQPDTADLAPDGFQVCACGARYTSQLGDDMLEFVETLMELVICHFGLDEALMHTARWGHAVERDERGNPLSIPADAIVKSLGINPDTIEIQILWNADSLGPDTDEPKPDWALGNWDDDWPLHVILVRSKVNPATGN